MLATSVPSFRIARTGAQWAAIAVVLTALGCSGSSATSPADAPSGSAAPPQIAPSVDTMVSGDLRAGIATMGLYDYRLDTKSGEFTLTPGRAVAAVGDAFALDLTSAFTTNAFGCANCLEITGIERAGGDIGVSFRAKHPFGDTLTSGRADLHVNNVRLVLLEQGSEPFFGQGQAPVEGRVDLVVNANGYTALPSTFVTPPAGLTSTLFPFVVFETGDNFATPTGNFSATTGWGGVLNVPTGYNVLAQGASAETTVSFNLAAAGGGILEGQIALLGNFIVSAGNKAQRPTPDYYMPEGAMPEAWKIDVTAPTSFTADPTNQFDLVTVAISDWQQGGVVDAGFPGVDKNGLKSSGDVQEVVVSIPAFGSTEFSSATPTGGSGTLAAPLTYEVTVTKPDTLTSGGDYLGLVKVIDSRTNFNAIDETLNAATGISQLAEVASYQPFTVTVINPNQPPTCDGYTVNGAAPSVTPLVIPAGYNAGLNVALNFGFTNDADGTITSVDVDWSYDGSNFNVEGNLAAPGTLNAPAKYLAPATIGVRFTDDDLASTICTVAVGNVYVPTTTLAPATAAIGPSQLSNLTANGSDMSLGRMATQMVSYGNTVYALCKQDLSSATLGVTYLARSTDGGVTWPLANNIQLAPGLASGPLGTTKFNAVSMGINSDGTSLAIVGINSATGSTSSGNVVISRVNTGTFTLDPVVRAISLEDLSAGFDPAFNGFEAEVVAHPTNPQIMFVLSDDGTPRALRLCTIGNFKNATAAGVNVANSLTLVRSGGGAGFAMLTDGVTATSLFDPVAFVEASANTIHLVAQGGSGLPATGYFTYREYDITGNAFVGGAETQFQIAEATQSNREPGIAVGPDGRAIVVGRSDGPSGTDKAMITKAANATLPYNFATARRLDPDWDGTIQGNQEKPSLQVDKTTGLIYVAIADFRDGPVESGSNNVSIWETVLDANLQVLVDGRKYDAPGITDNNDSDRTARVWIVQDGAPTTKRWIYYWQDASRKFIAGQQDLVYRTAQ